MATRQVSINTSAPWKAELFDTSGSSQEDWVTITPSQGPAGTQTITVSVTANTEGITHTALFLINLYTDTTYDTRIPKSGSLKIVQAGSALTLGISANSETVNVDEYGNDKSNFG